MSGEKQLSGSRDNMLKVWEARSGQCLQTFLALPDRDYATIDDRTLGTVPSDPTAPLPFIQACSPGAWRHFGWRWTDPRTGRQRLLAAEHFGRFPA